MKKKNTFFQPYSKNGFEGYNIPVRNSMNNRTEMEFIPVGAKSYFEEKFGETILSDNDFIDWYTRNANLFN